MSAKSEAEASPWLAPLSLQTDDDANERDNPWVTLYCFPHAGGTAESAFSWLTPLVHTTSGTPVSVQVVCLPGRGQRMEEEPVASLKEATDAIAGAIETTCRTPICLLFGHSFGALLAASVARKLTAKVPSFLILSAHPSGSEHSLTLQEFYKQDLTDDTTLLHAIEQFGLLNTKDRELLLQSEPSVRQVVLAPLRQDLKLAQEYSCPVEKSNIPILAMGGENDPWCPLSSLEGWSQWSTQCQTPMQFPGGHFYFLQQGQAVRETLLNVIETLVQDELLLSNKLSILTGPCLELERKPVHELVERQAALTPNNIAIEDWQYQLELNYQDCLAQSLLLARHLQTDGGVRPGDIVGVFLPHCADFILTNLAIFFCGAAIFPLQVGYTTTTTLQAFLQDVKVACVVTYSENVERLPSDAACPVLLLDRPQKSKGEPSESWVDLLLRRNLPPFDRTVVTLDDLAYVTTTSGTTGKPKVVLNSHRGSTVCFLARIHKLPYEQQEREGLNLFFVWECLRPLMCGKTAVVIPDTTIYDPRALISFLRKHRIHRIMINPSLLTNVMESCSNELLVSHLEHMTHIFLEGEVVPSHLVRAWDKVLTNVTLWNIYSTWESLDVTMCNLSALDNTNNSLPAAPAGTPLPNVIAYIVDSKMAIVPKGVPGELLIAGPGVSMGYNDAEKTLQNFVANPFLCEKLDLDFSSLYRTGDLAVVQDDEQLVVKGRADEQTVKIRAFKVSLPSVESAIMNTAEKTGVSGAVIVPQLDPQSKQPVSLAAYMVFKLEEGEISPQEAVRRVHMFLLETLPEYAVPTYFVPLEKFPVKAGSGHKLDKAALPNPSTFLVGVRQPSRLGQSMITGHDVPLSTGKSLEPMLAAMRRILERDDIGPDDNFFHAGGHSLRAASLVSVLSGEYGIVLTVLDVYTNPTASRLAGAFGGATATATAKIPQRPRDHHQPRGEEPVEIAVIGMEGRFPGAPSVAHLWKDILLERSTAVRQVSEQEFIDRDVPAKVYRSPSWVPMAYAVDDADKFDAYFWGISQHEASMMDPQHRLFMEVAWAALENAGYAPRTGTPERTGVFAACGIDGYLHHHLRGGGLYEPLDPGSCFLTEIGNEKDYISSRVSFGLDILGPSVTVTSACSSGLSAIIQGASSLASGETDMVLSGASALTFPNLGYLYETGLVSSPDGIVRPFDERANGTVFGDSVGCVVMKRLSDAEKDGDDVLAVIKGWGQSNDGRQKAGYAAPSSYGQSLAIEDAIRMSKVDPETISYIECHATATSIGDGIEVMGLVQAYDRLRTQALDSQPSSASKRTALGSVKGNIGHANAAAGVTGFIKTVAMLQNKVMVPTANLDKVSQEISEQLSGSPFYVLEDDCPVNWSASANGTPLRAGVSSFGIGGANAHCVLEEYVGSSHIIEPSDFSIGEEHLLTVSAATESSLFDTMKRLSTSFCSGVLPTDSSLASIAYTLQTGREHFKSRFSCPFQSLSGAAEQLDMAVSRKTAARPVNRVVNSTPSVALVFPGQGSQYQRMGEDLFKGNRLFRETMIQCAEIAEPRLGFNFLDFLYPKDSEDSLDNFDRATVVQPSLFAIEYAMATLLLSFGVKPVVVCGHSAGEIVAATISGILSLDDAVALIAVRAKASEECLTEGRMLAVAASVEEVRKLTESKQNSDQLWIALVNSATDCVVAGAPDAIDSFTAELKTLEIGYKRLRVSHAFHTPMMAPAAADVVETLSDVSLSPPKIPMTSNVTGSWLQNEACDPVYWGKHMSYTVEWSQNVECLLRWKPDIVVEVGPGRTLSALIGKFCDHIDTKPPVCLQSMRRAKVKASDTTVFVELIGDLWNEGLSVDFSGFHPPTGRRKAKLPTYAFEKRSFWTNAKASIYVDPAPESERTIINASLLDIVERNSLLVPIHIPKSSSGSVRYKLYCFPFAGGTSTAFQEWRNPPLDLHVVVVDPGMCTGLETGSSDLTGSDLTAKIARAICEDVGPFDKVIFCGMSAGALKAIEVFTSLPSSVQENMVLFCAAGRAPPQGIVPITESGTIDLEQYSLASQEVMRSPEWNSFFLPRLMADLEDDERAYKRISSRIASLPSSQGILQCPLLVCCGSDDPSFPTSDAHLWSAVTTGTTSTAIFRGNHSFLVDQDSKIFERVCLELSAVTGLKASCSLQSPLDFVPHTYSIEWRRLRCQIGEESVDSSSTFFGSLGDSPIRLSSESLKALRNGDTTLVLLLTSSDGSPDKMERQAWAMMDLMQQVVRLESSGLTEIIIICPSSTSGSLAAGASKSVPLEFPNITCRRIFLDDDIKTQQAVVANQSQDDEKKDEDAVYGAVYEDNLSDTNTSITPFATGAPEWVQKALGILRSIEENDLWLRRNGRCRVAAFAPRLQPLVAESQMLDNYADLLGHRRPGEAFLVTGGTGGIGSALVDWLIDEQAVLPRDIVLLTRRDFSPSRGVQVIPVDCTSVEALLQCTELRGLESVAGIFHLAGVIDDAIITNMTMERVERAARPKASVAEALSRLVYERDWDPEFLFNFSSTSSLFGYPGQSNYCAANAFLDAQSTWKTGDDSLPVVTVNWGPWAEVGMSKQGSKAYKMALEDGDTPLRNHEAFLSLSHLVRSIDSKQFAVCNVDWAKSMWKDSPLLSDLRVPNSESASTTSVLTEATSPSSGSEGDEDRVETFLKSHVSSWRLDDTMAELGVDSLDMVRIRGSFQKDFAISAPLSLFMRPNVSLRELSHDLRALLLQTT